MTLRPLTMADADKMLEIKNYPETRAFAIASHDEIKKEDHYKWLEKNIQYFQVVMDDDKMIGVIRIEDYEVSIWIDRKYWGQGLASYILEQETELDMTAKIVEGNIASMRAFLNAGFKSISYNGTYYIFQK